MASSDKTDLLFKETLNKLRNENNLNTGLAVSTHADLY